MAGARRAGRGRLFAHALPVRRDRRGAAGGLGGSRATAIVRPCTPPPKPWSISLPRWYCCNSGTSMRSAGCSRPCQAGNCCRRLRPSW
jgi:hypothetical protein